MAAKITTDQDAVDAIATLLGTTAEWPVDMPEWIADIIGQVRPHPGDASQTYAADFRAATGRNVPEEYVDSETGEDD